MTRCAPSPGNASIRLVIPSRLLLASEEPGRDCEIAARFLRGNKIACLSRILLRGKLRPYPGSSRLACIRTDEALTRTRSPHSPRGAKLLSLLLCLLIFPALAAAAGPASVTFSLDFPNSDPAQYSITVQSDGHAKYKCSARVSADSDEREAYQTEFDLTSSTRARIFELAAQSRYFSGKVDSGNSKLAFTGTKKLIYQDGNRTSSASYNFSTVPAVQQLTLIFQSMAATLDYGRRLTYYHRYQKLALDEELKRLETQAKDNELSELQAIHEVLKQIVDDPSVINVVRARAQRLMDMPPSSAQVR